MTMQIEILKIQVGALESSQLKELWEMFWHNHVKCSLALL